MPDNADGSDNKKSPDTIAGQPGIFDILDLTPPLRKTYQTVMKAADVSYEEISKLIADETPEELRMYLNLLERLGYLEKYAANGTARFKLKSMMRNVSSLPGTIWDKLENQK